jgi:pimeloyl-ACP methyl ester carboxylesterase
MGAHARRPAVSSTAPVPGGRVEYQDIPGDPARAPLLFLHEGLGSVGLWRGFPERIAAETGRRAVAYSRLGHGWSDPPPAPRTPRFMHEEAATVVPALRERLGLDRPALIGHSDGASIALLHAATADVPALVVLAPHVFVEELGRREIAIARDRYEHGDLRSRMARHHRDPDVAFRNWNDVWLDPAFRSWDLRPELPAISCPTLAVQGTADPYGTPAHVEAIRDTATGPVELLLLDGGHAPHLEHRDAVTAALTRFLAPLP